MRVYIVEDNLSHLKLLKLKVESLGYKVVGSAQFTKNALDDIKVKSPHIILLDINFRGDEKDGIDLARQIKTELTTPIIFITSHSEDKIVQNAIEIEPAGYLVKPVEVGNLKANIELALHKQVKSNQFKTKEYTITKQESNSTYLTVRIGQRLQVIPFNELKILKVDSKNYVTLINSENKAFSVRDSLKNLINTILPDYFIRTHMTYCVNINFISYIDEKEQTLYLKTNEQIPLGKSFKELVYKKMNIK